MNNLSWLIYFSEVFGNISDIVQFIALVSFLAAVATGLVCWLQNQVQYIGPSFKYLIPMCIISTILFCIIPSQQTMILIDASQIGQAVATNPQVDSVVNPGITLLDTWIKSETKKLIEDQNSNSN
jgi:hypothetical protein